MTSPIPIGTSIVLIAAGAILRFAITRSQWGYVDIATVGSILIIVGIVGLVLSILFMFLVSGRREREVEEVPTRRRERF